MTWYIFVIRTKNVAVNVRVSLPRRTAVQDIETGFGTAAFVAA